MKLTNCNTADYFFVQIKNNQTLQDILTIYNTTLNNVIRNNPNIELYEGEIIKILNKTFQTHIVKPMETITSICEKYNIDVDYLIKINNLTSKRLFIGQNLKVKD